VVAVSETSSDFDLEELLFAFANLVFECR